MKTYGVTIHSTGSYVPKNIVYNDELTQWMDTSDEWIKKELVSRKDIFLKAKIQVICV